MKRALLIILTIPLFIACNQDIKDENSKLKAENLEMRTQNDNFETSLKDYETARQAIQANLDSIRAKEEAIQSVRNGDLDGGKGDKERILADIAAIDALLAENRNTITDLNNKITRYATENGGFKKKIRYFKNQVATLTTEAAVKDSAITTLKGELVSKNFKLEELNTTLNRANSLNQAQSAKIAQQTSALNTAYFAVGSYSELKLNKVVKKEGGIIGIGGTKTLADDFNKDYFTKIDISKTKIIQINSERKVEIISEHPTDSYKMNMDGDKTLSLEVLDSDKFWNSAKYLVVMTK